MVAGTDTTSSTIEWAMAELLSNPEKLEKLRKELQHVIGDEDNDVEESHHVTRLPFLRAVVKETLRLHPLGPLLVVSTSQGTRICRDLWLHGAKKCTNSGQRVGNGKRPKHMV